MGFFEPMTPVKTLEFTRTLARIVGCFPPPPSTEEWKKQLYKMYWVFCILLTSLTNIPIVYDLILYREDTDRVSLHVAELCPLCLGMWKLILCKHHEKRMLACFAEFENFLKEATEQELELLQEYINRCNQYYHIMFFCIITAVVGFIGSPAFLPDYICAVHTSYPFHVGKLQTLFCILIALDTCLIGLLVSIDFVLEYLIWFAAARFELLSFQLEKVSSVEELCTYIKKHQYILKYAEDVNELVGLIAYSVGINTAVGTIFGGIQLLRDIGLLDKARFIAFVIVGTLQLLGYCWPAETLMTNSRAIGYAAYSSEWIGKSPEMKNLLRIVMQRSIHPSIITVGGMVPQLSLSYYGSFLSTSVSYFTTIRATM